MKPESIEFQIAYIATSASGETLVVNELTANANAALCYIESHDLPINLDTLYKAHDKRTVAIDEPITRLTRKAIQLVNAMPSPITWALTYQRLDPVIVRGNYKKRTHYARKCAA